MLYNTTEAIMRAKLAGWVTLYAVAIIFIALRIYSRIHIFGALAVDDWLMVGAGIAYTGSMVTEVFIWKAFVDFTIVIYIKAAFASFFTIVLAMWLIKFSVWCFMKRLMHGKWMNRAANAVFVVLVISYIALNVFDLAWCSPIDHVWKFTPDSCIFRLKTMVIFDGSLNALSDILLMILPLPLIWKVRLPLATKLSLTALFGLGFVVIAAVIMASYMGSQADFIKGANFTIWSNVSLTAATAVACAPQIRTLFLRSTRKNRTGEIAGTSFDISNPDHVLATLSKDYSEQGSYPEADEKGTSEKKKSIPLTLSSKYLTGGGKVGVGDGRATIESVSETASI